MNGRGRRCVVPSTVTWEWAIASSSADWVRGGARFSSSARTSSWNSGPGRNWNSPLAAEKTCTPVTSAGMRSAVNWMRASRSPQTRASPSASVVLPTPGASSRSRWPPATIVVSASSTAERLPRTTRPSASLARLSSACAAEAARGERGSAGAVTVARAVYPGAARSRLDRLFHLDGAEPKVPEHPCLVSPEPRERHGSVPERPGECIDREVDEGAHLGEVHRQGHEGKLTNGVDHRGRRAPIEGPGEAEHPPLVAFLQPDVQ